jgi:DNA adenine methylase
MTQSPFRYPGAKNKMLPLIMHHLDQIISGENHFIDLFVGGGSVLLEVANKYPDIQLYANDKDYWISSFWSVIAGDDSKKLDALLSMVEVPPTLELFYKLRSEPARGEVECAYRAIFFNRTTFSGIFNSGPIGGKSQKRKYTIDCRYNVEKIQKKILNCHKLLAGRTNVTCLDFSQHPEFINTNYPVYLDPPYVKAGKALYAVFMEDEEHVQLSKLLSNRKNWALSYDDHELVRSLYKDCNFYDTEGNYSINGSKTEWSQKTELIILPQQEKL